MNENEISRIAAATNALRPDWPTTSIRSLLNRPELINKPRRDVAVALAWVACEADSKTPARVIEAGPWWRAAALDNGAETVTHTGKTVGLRHGDPRAVCAICDMWRADCESRSTTSGHEFVARIKAPVAETTEVARLRALIGGASEDHNESEDEG